MNTKLEFVLHAAENIQYAKLWMRGMFSPELVKSSIGYEIDERRVVYIFGYNMLEMEC